MCGRRGQPKSALKKKKKVFKIKTVTVLPLLKKKRGGDTIHETEYNWFNIRLQQVITNVNMYLLGFQNKKYH